jgi:hypothetical protein
MGSVRSIHVSPPSSIAIGDVELGDGSTVQHPGFAIDAAGTFHAAWQSLGSPGGLIYRSSTDGGASWSEPQTLSDDEFFTKAPRLVVTPGGMVHVFFASSDLFHRSGMVGAFGPLETVTVAIGNVPSTGAVTDDEVAHAFWTDAAGVQHASSTGGAWPAPVLVSGTEGAVAQELAAAVAPDGTVVVAWIEQAEPSAVRYAVVPPA